jgi:deoxyribose-phosphate aldolase
LPFTYPLTRVPAVDQVGVEERAATLATRSIKREAKLWALQRALSMVDLTTLEGADTPGRVRALCRKAIRPDPEDPTLPAVAAVCVYPALIPTVVGALAGSGVKAAAVATAFPSGQTPLRVKLAEVRETVALGAEEIDMVMARGAFLAGRYGRVFEEIVRTKEVCGAATLKVILEVGELGTYDNVRKASMLAMAAGADFIKTSTGKIPRAATLPVTLVMLEAVREFFEETGTRVGVKAAGGIATAKQAVQYLVQAHEVLGPEWLTPELFRLGASSLVNDLLLQIRKQKRGAYQSPDYFTLD